MAFRLLSLLVGLTCVAPLAAAGHEDHSLVGEAMATLAEATGDAYPHCMNVWQQPRTCLCPWPDPIENVICPIPGP